MTVAEFEQSFTQGIDGAATDPQQQARVCTERTARHLHQW
jgi:hypothetical protein